MRPVALSVALLLVGAGFLSAADAEPRGTGQCRTQRHPRAGHASAASQARAGHPARGGGRTRLIRSRAIELSQAPTLFLLIANSDAVVVGSVGPVLRVSGSPVDRPVAALLAEPPALPIETLYAFSVERYIHGQGPRIIKVRQIGGDLGDLTYIREGNPRLQRGERYVLFLKALVTPKAQRLGYLYAEDLGVYHYNGDLDEWGQTEPLHGKLWLHGGRVTVPSDPLLPNLPTSWAFDPANSPYYSGATRIIGMTEDEALAEIARTAEEVTRVWRK